MIFLAWLHFWRESKWKYLATFHSKTGETRIIKSLLEIDPHSPSLKVGKKTTTTIRLRCSLWLRLVLFPVPNCLHSRVRSFRLRDSIGAVACTLLHARSKRLSHGWDPLLFDQQENENSTTPWHRNSLFRIDRLAFSCYSLKNSN